MLPKKRYALLLKSMLFISMATDIFAVQLDKITNILGVRDNQLIGYGLIVGLDGTGDSSSPFTQQTLSSMLQSVNIKVSPNAIKSKNIAAVIVTANLPAFVRHGDKLDVTVSSIGDAKSLKGGTLLLTPLKGLDGKVYAIAQGRLNLLDQDDIHDTRANILRGALVEREVEHQLGNSPKMTLTLKHSNFMNAIKIQKAINAFFKDKTATAIDSRTIELVRPKNFSPVEFIATLQEIDVDYSVLDKIVIDSKSGTIIAGLEIKVEPVLVTHKDLTVKISPALVLIPSDQDIGDGVTVNQNSGIITTAEKKPTVASIARALQKMGVVPMDMIAIFTAMKKAGAIVVDIEVL